MKEIVRGDIFYADLNPVCGSEQGGIRPVLVIQNNTGNKFSPTIIIAPITSSHNKVKLPTHVEISSTSLSKNSVVLLEQIRTLDKRLRLSEYVGQLDTKTMDQIDQAIGISLDIRCIREVEQNG